MNKNQETVYTKVTLGSSNQASNLQARIWLTGTPKQIIAELGAKGFEVITKRPSRATEKAPKAAKAKAKKSKKASRKARTAAPQAEEAVAA